MKVQYINILLFALLLNILVYNQRNYYITPRHTETNRSLCECELYAPSNYDSDPEMKRVMQQFVDRTTQRFHEYDERMKTTRQKCKDKCDKEIQKIILKDKLEKELAEKFVTLQTDIQSDAIPTCICEKSLADKTEKFCLNCGVNVGGGVTLSSGVLGGIGAVAVNAWKDAALAAAKEFAEKAGAAQGAIAGKARGMAIVIKGLKEYSVDKFCPDLFESIGSTIPYNDAGQIAKTILENLNRYCGVGSTPDGLSCMDIRIELGMFLQVNREPPSDNIFIQQLMERIVSKATDTAKTFAKNTAKEVTAEITARETALIEGRFESSITSINASIFAIVVIVLIMVIIYLILRYRRKKKMKKKLQYIKLLEE